MNGLSSVMRRWKYYKLLTEICAVKYSRLYRRKPIYSCWDNFSCISSSLLWDLCQLQCYVNHVLSRGLKHHFDVSVWLCMWVKLFVRDAYPSQLMSVPVRLVCVNDLVLKRAPPRSSPVSALPGSVSSWQVTVPGELCAPSVFLPDRPVLRRD